MEPLLLTEAALSITAERFHGHAQRVLDHNPGLEAAVRATVSGQVGIVRTARKKKGSGLTAGSLNSALKANFLRAGGWSFEATVREGAIFDWPTPDSKREGFDIARYDTRANAAKLWSLCFGSRRMVNGDDEWLRFRARRADLKPVADEIEALGTQGSDLRLDSVESTILGDIQFGNWGLGYRDMLRLIDADDQIRADLYVYVTGEASLNRYLSDSIVTFRQIVEILNQFPRLIRVPVWAIGLGSTDLA